MIDYGYPAAELYRDHRLGDHPRLQRARGHRQPVSAGGEQDLTVHVDFTRLMEAAAARGMEATPVVTQDISSRGWSATAGPAAGPETEMPEYHRPAAVMRLIDPGGLGRFRVVALAKDAPPPLPTGFTPDDLPASLRI